MGMKESSVQSENKWRGVLRDVLKPVRALIRSPVSLAGLIIVIGSLFVAVFAPWISPYNAFQVNFAAAFQAPSLAHVLGTDETGRDVLSMIFWALRPSLEAAAIIVSIGASFGVVLGLYAGYFGGRLDELIMRLTDIFLAFPSFMLALVVVAALGHGYIHTIIAVTVIWWPGYTRLIRSSVLGEKGKEYIVAAELIGQSKTKIMFRHLLPNVISPIIVQGTLDVGNAILTVAALGFLGLSISPPTPELGSMVSNGEQYLFTAPWAAIFPGIAIFVVAIGYNLVGDGLRDYLDPRSRQEMTGN
jgi:peptide/nickel transport system permease protein